jgi:hypothetical protein
MTNGYRIIVYDVELPELELAIAKATAEYKKRFEQQPTIIAVEPCMVGDVEKLIESKELELQIDKHFASGGTLQIGR